MRTATAIALTVSLLLSLAACEGVRTGVVDDARLLSAGSDSANWLMYGRTYDEHRFSPLTAINEQTVGGLGLVWSRELGTTRGLEATPLVLDGVMYLTSSWSVVHAVDARSGETLWSFDPLVPRGRAAEIVCCDVVNRGVALYDGNVYVGTLDGRLVALDRLTGEPVWDVLTIDPNRPYAITGYPRVANGLVMIGNAGAEFGVRGYVSAFDAETGALVWRTYTVPGDPSLGFESEAMEAAADTWRGEWWTTGGGGTVWEGIVYDPDLDMVYFGTGNGTAWYRELRSEGVGDNLYVASIMALRARTGEHVWHFQTSPGDDWDFDATQPLLFADLDVDGAPRAVVMQASKNGFFFVLDRATGDFVSGAPFVDGITWASGLDDAGRALDVSWISTQGGIVSPAPSGAHNWNPMAFNPSTGLVYLPAKVGTQGLHVPDTSWTYNPDGENLGADFDYDGPLVDALSSLPSPRGELLAWDPVRGRAAWRAPYPVVEGAGALTTAGNLVFQGRADGVFAAYRATDGTKLWEFDAGTGIMAPAITYLVDGVQHIAVLAGWGGPDGLYNDPGFGPVKPGYGRLLTFALGADASFAPPAYGYPEPPVPAAEIASSPAEIAEGERLYKRHCVFCHGLDVISGPLPDLRYASAEVHATFDDIVRGGVRAPLGMPSFEGKLEAEQVRAIQAYVLMRARESAAGR